MLAPVAASSTQFYLPSVQAPVESALDKALCETARYSDVRSKQIEQDASRKAKGVRGLHSARLDHTQRADTRESEQSQT